VRASCESLGKLWNNQNGALDFAVLGSPSDIDPDVIAAEIAEDLQAALNQVTQIAAGLKRSLIFGLSGFTVSTILPVHSNKVPLRAN
jgi:hypothetical protein